MATDLKVPDTFATAFSRLPDDHSVVQFQSGFDLYSRKTARESSRQQD
jgi:hypothetical protein